MLARGGNTREVKDLGAGLFGHLGVVKQGTELVGHLPSFRERHTDMDFGFAASRGEVNALAAQLGHALIEEGSNVGRVFGHEVSPLSLKGRVSSCVLTLVFTNMISLGFTTMTEGSSAAPGDLPRFTLPRAMTFAYDTLGDAFEFASAREGSALRRLMMMHFSDVFVIDTAGNFQFREEPSGMVRVQFGKDANGAIEVQALPGKRFIDLTAALAELLLTVVHEIDGWPVIDMGLAESVAA